MNTFLKFASVVALAASTIATSANAALVFVGSWQVDQGPSWTVVPTAFTGQQAAAMLFGGVASNYSISTIDSNVANIDNLAWVSVWGAAGFPDCAGFPCGRKVSESAVTSTGGLYQNPGDESAFVRDWAGGSEFTNYAFKNTVPEPASWAMLIAGFGLTGAAMRRRRSTAVAA
jgi:PEP-CTERM motif